jgi:hypothetical protein
LVIALSISSILSSVTGVLEDQLAVVAERFVARALAENPEWTSGARH